MFSNLKEHSIKIDDSIRNIEKDIDVMVKSIFSVVEGDVSDTSSIFFDKLFTELDDIDSSVNRMISESKNKANNLSSELGKYWSFIEQMKLQLDNLEDDLRSRGYIKKEDSSLLKNQEILKNSCEDFTVDIENGHY